MRERIENFFKGTGDDKTCPEDVVDRIDRDSTGLI